MSQSCTHVSLFPVWLTRQAALESHKAPVTPGRCRVTNSITKGCLWDWSGGFLWSAFGSTELTNYQWVSFPWDLSETIMCEWWLRFSMRGNRWQNFLTLTHWTLFWDMHVTGLMLQRKHSGLALQYYIFKILIMESDYDIQLSEIKLIHISMG